MKTEQDIINEAIAEMEQRQAVRDRITEIHKQERELREELTSLLFKYEGVQYDWKSNLDEKIQEEWDKRNEKSKD